MSFQTTPDDPLIKRVETVGKVQPHVKAKIVDPQGHILPVNTPGELYVSGYLLQDGCVLLASMCRALCSVLCRIIPDIGEIKRRQIKSCRRTLMALYGCRQAMRQLWMKKGI